ncbi:MAG: lipid A deacylase LpxR family protein [Gallionella sp.]|nr:lipid A deacylase LpxR family protein [Gallionella sp.]
MKFWKVSGQLLVLLWMCCGTVWADGTPKPSDECAAESGKHLLWENDVLTGKLFGRSDKWYTNGFKYYNSYQKDCVPKYLPNFLSGQIERLRDIQPNGEDTYTIQTGNVIGQLMFTPKNLTVATPQPMDRFWGGWLYAGIVAQRQPYDKRQQSAKQRNKDELETLELDVGVTGPISGAEQLQRVIHAASNSTMPSGWGNQIKAEPGVQLSYSHIKRWKYPSNDGQSHLDFSGHYGGAVGTLFDYVNGGFTVRFGSKLTDEAPNAIESPSIGQFKETDNAAYLLARLDIKGVLHNTFIDGSLLRRDPHVSYLSSKQIVPQLTFGGVLGLKYNDDLKKDGARLSLLIHRRGSEFRSPAGSAAIFNFATLNFEWDL